MIIIFLISTIFQLNSLQCDIDSFFYGYENGCYTVATPNSPKTRRELGRINIDNLNNLYPEPKLGPGEVFLRPGFASLLDSVSDKVFTKEKQMELFRLVNNILSSYPEIRDISHFHVECFVSKDGVVQSMFLRLYDEKRQIINEEIMMQSHALDLFNKVRSAFYLSSWDKPILYIYTLVFSEWCA